jgi:hypothetical protein
MPIDGVYFLYLAGQKIYRHRHIEGYCANIPKGLVSIGFRVGVCPKHTATVDAVTGWGSTSRIVVEEIPPAQI